MLRWSTLLSCARQVAVNGESTVRGDSAHLFGIRLIKHDVSNNPGTFFETRWYTLISKFLVESSYINGISMNFQGVLEYLSNSLPRRQLKEWEMCQTLGPQMQNPTWLTESYRFKLCVLKETIRGKTLNLWILSCSAYWQMGRPSLALGKQSFILLTSFGLGIHARFFSIFYS